MTESIESISTEVGVINGRDGIFIYKIVHDIRGRSMMVEGTLNGELCSNNYTGKEWITFRLTFSDPVAYECQKLDRCHWENDTISSFDVQRGGFEENSKPYSPEFKMYYLSAYDEMLKIVATDFLLEITE